MQVSSDPRGSVGKKGQKNVSLEHKSDRELGNGLALDGKIRSLPPLAMTRLNKISKT